MIEAKEGKNNVLNLSQHSTLLLMLGADNMSCK